VENLKKGLYIINGKKKVVRKELRYSPCLSAQAGTGKCLNVN
jgi:hypothetical protein